MLEEWRFDQQTIAKIVGVGKSTVNRIASKLKNSLSLKCKWSERCRPKRKTSTRDYLFLVHKVKIDRTLTIQHVKIEMNLRGIQISAQTIRRRLVDAGLSEDDDL